MKLPFTQESRNIIYLTIALVFLWYTSLPLQETPTVPSIEPRPAHSNIESTLPNRPTESNSAFVSKGEKKMQEILEKMYKAKFKKVRPSWLKNPKTGRSLELDCYNEELKIAGEYNGEQHYKYRPFFHKTEADFEEQVYRDKIKVEECKKNGITLLIIPFTVKLVDMEKYICEQIKLLDATK